MRIIISVLVLVLVVVAVPGEAKEKTTKQQMARFGSHFSELMLLSADAKQFAATKNKQNISRLIKKLEEASVDFSHGSRQTESDPNMGFVADKLRLNIELIDKEFGLNRTESARKLIKKTTNFCISCHTRTSRGSDKLNFAASEDKIKQLTAFERGEFYTATRHFDNALLNYEQVLNDKAVAKKDPKQWEGAAVKLLAISVRIKNDPRLTLDFLSKIRDEKSAPKKLADDTKAWQRSVREWIAEVEGKNKKTTMTLADAERLAARSAELTKKGERQGLIPDLRASRILHLYLDKQKSGETAQKALYLAGQVESRLELLNLWGISDTYYLRCIYQKPKTKIAAKCFDNYAKILGDQSKDYLKKLEKLAK